MRIIGVDFSGANPETGKTWVAEGSLSDGGLLTLNSCHPIIRADLTAKLQSLKDPALAAMYFPFSVPGEFANYWQRSKVLDDGWEMPNLWSAAAHLTLRWDKFKGLQTALRLEKFKREPKRIGDPPESKSPLHTVSPNMVPMTFKGMQMLNRLWLDARKSNKPLRIPPLHPDPEQDSITLLEVMPGATLDSISIKRTGAKGGGAAELREKILMELRSKLNEWGIEVRFSRRSDLYQTCRANDDALDAVVAAVTATMWHKDPQQFRHPEDVDGIDWKTVRLEGWLYAPKKVVKKK